LTGWLKTRVERLLAHQITLLAYHLPLDAHPEFGNNAQLGRRLQLQADGRFGEQDLGWLGRPEQPAMLESFSAQVRDALGREPVVVAGDGRPIRRVAWCTGGA